MYQFMILLHAIGAVVLGFYLVFPFLLMPIKRMEDKSKSAYLAGLYQTSRIMQYVLIAQLLTGGYLIGKIKYNIAWMVVMIVLFLFVGAISGIMNARVKKAFRQMNGGENVAPLLVNVNTLAWIVSISLVILIYLMEYPRFR